MIAAAVLFYLALSYVPSLLSLFGKILVILTPFLWGLAITYLLFPMVKSMRASVFGFLSSKFKNKKTASGLSKWIAIIIAEILLMLAIAMLVYLIIPQLYASIEMIVSNSNVYVTQLSEWLRAVLADFPELEEYVSGTLDNINTTLFDWLRNAVLPAAGNLVTNVTSGVYSVFKAVYNLILGIIVSIYILADVEAFKGHTKRLLYSIFSVQTTGKILEGTRFVDKTFMNFITGKLVDSLIIGVICYIACAVLKMPYALLVSVIIGMTNVIPFFGPLIGAIPCTLIILMVDPLKCLFFIIIIVVLQTLDGNVIGPKILGSSIGIKGIWIIFSIILGAGLFGFWGMLLGVPVFTVISTLIDRAVTNKLKRNGLPDNAESYERLICIDEKSHIPVRKAPPEFVVEDSATEETAKDKQ